jgi:hypothetical protein
MRDAARADAARGVDPVVVVVRKAIRHGLIAPCFGPIETAAPAPAALEAARRGRVLFAVLRDQRGVAWLETRQADRREASCGCVERLIRGRELRLPGIELGEHPRQLGRRKQGREELACARGVELHGTRERARLCAEFHGDRQAFEHLVPRHAISVRELDRVCGHDTRIDLARHARGERFPDDLEHRFAPALRLAVGTGLAREIVVRSTPG